MEEQDIILCFEPIINKKCRILILGSAPGVISRKEGFYYANPQNRFWKAVSFIYGVDFTSLSVEGKKQALINCKIALWDVYSCSKIKKGSSSDAKLNSGQINDVYSLIKDTDIKTVFITSKKAYKAFIKSQNAASLKELSVDIVSLPSPSAANRSVYKTDEELILVWQTVFKEHSAIN